MVAAAPDWMLSYFVPASALPMGAVHGLFLLALILAALSGHTVTAALLQRGSRALAIGALLSGLGLWFGLWGLTLDRYVVIGSHADWLAARAPPLAQSPQAQALNIIGVIDAIIVAVPALYLWRTGRRLKAA
jgi:hypothetical protein